MTYLFLSLYKLCITWTLSPYFKEIMSSTMRDWALPVEEWHETANCSCPQDITPIIRLCGGNLFVEDPPKIRVGSHSHSTSFCFLNGQFTQARVTSRCYPAGPSNCGCGKIVTLQSTHKRRRLDLFTPLLGQLSPAVQPWISIFENLQICTMWNVRHIHLEQFCSLHLKYRNTIKTI